MNCRNSTNLLSADTLVNVAHSQELMALFGVPCVPYKEYLYYLKKKIKKAIKLTGAEWQYAHLVNRHDNWRGVFFSLFYSHLTQKIAKMYLYGVPAYLFGCLVCQVDWMHFSGWVLIGLWFVAVAGALLFTMKDWWLFTRYPPLTTASKLASIQALGGLIEPLKESAVWQALYGDFDNQRMKSVLESQTFLWTIYKITLQEMARLNTP
ncbi:MAG: hypothetical protein Q4C68_04875 [Moraxella sp.]|nr:hypothetical protein [Moraxella sp.]